MRVTTPRSTSWSMSFSPRPSTSNASRVAKWRSEPRSWAVQETLLGQTIFLASPAARISRRSTGVPQTGQVAGNTVTGRSSCPSSGTRASTRGMTSPARLTITVSPTRRSRSRTKSSLCSVALVTVTPPTRTGASRATGVIAPERPTW